MTTQVRHPIWLPAVRPHGARTFATLYGLESFARASISSVIPIQAYDILQDKQHVSMLYTAVAILGLSATLLMPMLIERFARRWIYTAGAVGLMVGSACLLTNQLPGQVAGMLARVMGASALSITLNLYIMDHIRKTDFIHAESLRMAWSTVGWTGGPTLGVLLYARFGLLAAHAVPVLFALILLIVFWRYRLGDNALIRPGKSRPANPLANIGRFVSQPRLRVAWIIAFGRSCFWTTFFVYAPLLMVVTGQGKLAGGLTVSAGNALLFSALIWGKAGGRFGARKVMSFSFAAMTAMLLAAGYAGEQHPLVAACCLLACAFFCIALDALASTAFMRAVHAFERPQMSAVYRTYLDLSELLPPLFYSVVLAFFGLGAVFVTLAVSSAVCGWITWRYLPKRL